MQEYNIYDSSEAINKIKELFSSANVNVLIGSAFSLPILKTLNNVEKIMNEAVKSKNKDDEFKIKKDFFNNSIYPLYDLKIDDPRLNNQKKFIKILFDIIDLRDNSNFNKIINIFSTNYDDIIEIALEYSEINYFDGFNGRNNPIFSTKNYGKSIGKMNLLTRRIKEETSVNLYKIHGSLFWKMQGEDIVYDNYRDRLNAINKENDRDKFLDLYNNKLMIINPEENKYNLTVMNMNYYDQMRMFTNELEGDNTILLVYGFSFEDVHIYRQVINALHSNHSLIVLLFPHSQNDFDSFKNKFKDNNNVYCFCKKKHELLDDFSLSDMNDLLWEVYNDIK